MEHVQISITEQIGVGLANIISTIRSSLFFLQFGGQYRFARTVKNFLRENIQSIADKFKAKGISDYSTGLMEYHIKTAWMLRAHLS